VSILTQINYVCTLKRVRGCSAMVRSNIVTSGFKWQRHLIILELLLLIGTGIGPFIMNDLKSSLSIFQAPYLPLTALYLNVIKSESGYING
jgi:hypothetical protein